MVFFFIRESTALHNTDTTGEERETEHDAEQIQHDKELGGGHRRYERVEHDGTHHPDRCDL